MRLSDDLNLLARFLDLPSIAEEKPDTSAVEGYYRWTNWFYRQFHSKEGAMHFPIFLPNGATKHIEGLNEQARFVMEQASQAGQIVEIGCGSGYNLRQLAQRLPETHFIGIDATPLHIKQARNFAARANLPIEFTEGRFSALPLHNECADIVFAVESFDYSEDAAHDLGEIYRVLRKGGKFILYDTLLQPAYDQCTSLQKLASRLTAKGFAVQKWERLTNLQTYSRELGFEMRECVDLTHATKKNLAGFQWRVRQFFEQLLQMRPIRRVLPTVLLKHAMVGLLAPHVMKANVQGYYCVVWEKV